MTSAVVARERREVAACRVLLDCRNQQRNEGHFYGLALRLRTFHQRNQTLTRFAPLPHLSKSIRGLIPADLFHSLLILLGVTLFLKVPSSAIGAIAGEESRGRSVYRLLEGPPALAHGRTAPGQAGVCGRRPPRIAPAEVAGAVFNAEAPRFYAHRFERMGGPHGRQVAVREVPGATGPDAVPWWERSQCRRRPRRAGGDTRGYSRASTDSNGQKVRTAGCDLSRFVGDKGRNKERISQGAGIPKGGGNFLGRTLYSPLLIRMAARMLTRP